MAKPIGLVDTRDNSVFSDFVTGAEFDIDDGILYKSDDGYYIENVVCSNEHISFDGKAHLSEELGYKLHMLILIVEAESHKSLEALVEPLECSDEEVRGWAQDAYEQITDELGSS